jgi:FkbM family methyltransferase
MTIKRILRALAERLTRTQILRRLPRGVSVFSDIAELLPGYRIELIFDVGANIGQSARNYVALFPFCLIFCFEPVAETFRKLELNMADNKQVHCFPLALGSASGTGTMLTNGTSAMNYLLDDATAPVNSSGTRTEQVNVLTVDDFCQTSNIDHISYLKIDTEGRDLDVLIGAENLLTRQSIDLVEVEAGMNPYNQRHVPFETLKSYLEQHDYLLFGIYGQVSEWPDHKPHLRRSNAVFISRQMISTYKTPAELVATIE